MKTPHIKKIKRKIKKKLTPGDLADLVAKDSDRLFRKPLSRKQVKKNRVKTDRLIGGVEYKDIYKAPWSELMQQRSAEDEGLSDVQVAAKCGLPEPDLQSQLNETDLPKCSTCQGYGLWGIGEPTPIGLYDANEMPTIACPECGANANPADDEPALDITIGPIQSHGDIERALQKDFESKKKRLEDDPMEEALRQIKRDIAAGASNAYKYHGDDPQHQDWQDAEGNVLRWNGEQYEKIDESPNTGGILIVAGIALFLAYGLGALTAFWMHNPGIEYRDKIKTEYSRPMELNGIPDNPWRKAIPILPQDIKIEHGYDQGETRRG